MRIISKSRLKSFWEAAEHRSAEGPLRAWYSHVSSKTVGWDRWGDVKASFGNASIVGTCVVFDIGGNNYRLMVLVRYRNGVLLIQKIGTHAEYSKW